MTDVLRSSAVCHVRNLLDLKGEEKNSLEASLKNEQNKDEGYQLSRSTKSPTSSGKESRNSFKYEKYKSKRVDPSNVRYSFETPREVTDAETSSPFKSHSFLHLECTPESPLHQSLPMQQQKFSSIQDELTIQSLQPEVSHFASSSLVVDSRSDTEQCSTPAPKRDMASRLNASFVSQLSSDRNGFEYCSPDYPKPHQDSSESIQQAINEILQLAEETSNGHPKFWTKLSSLIQTFQNLLHSATSDLQKEQHCVRTLTDKLMTLRDQKKKLEKMLQKSSSTSPPTQDVPPHSMSISTRADSLAGVPTALESFLMARADLTAETDSLKKQNLDQQYKLEQLVIQLDDATEKIAELETERNFMEKEKNSLVSNATN